MKIFGGRASILGDTVMSLPLIHVLHKLYDKPEITFPIARKCCQAAPLYIDQPGINSIYITQDEEKLNSNELWNIGQNYDLFIDPTPNHPREQDWYNYRSCVEETILMAGERYYEEYKNLPIVSQKPKLKPWWINQNKPKYNKSCKEIAIFPFCGYGQGFERSPSKEWWQKLLKILIGDLDCRVYHFGYWKEPNLWYGDSWELDDEPKYIYKCYDSLFEQIQCAYECDINITLDSGTGWIMGALGINQISLICDWLPDHNKNLLALAPTNSKNTIETFFGEKSCDNIDINKVIEIIK